jgi:methionyl-tRNA formyltransferase
VRLLLVLEEMPFLQPQFAADLLSHFKDDHLAVAVVTRAPRIADSAAYLRRNLHRLRPGEFLRLAIRQTRDALRGLSSRENSVRGVASNFGVDWFEVSRDINDPEYLDKIRAFAPDVIFSSQPYIFREALLAIPKICCLNRHASLLPAYAGLWPVFHALRCGETETGVSIHVMYRKIDSGPVLARRKIPIEPGDTMLGLYEKCFRVSVAPTVEAIDSLRGGSIAGIETPGARSYFSFPTPDQWREFRARNKRII